MQINIGDCPKQNFYNGMNRKARKEDSDIKDHTGYQHCKVTEHSAFTISVIIYLLKRHFSLEMMQLKILSFGSNTWSFDSECA